MCTVLDLISWLLAIAAEKARRRSREETITLISIGYHTSVPRHHILRIVATHDLIVPITLLSNLHLLLNFASANQAVFRRKLFLFFRVVRRKFFIQMVSRTLFFFSATLFFLIYCFPLVGTPLLYL